MKCLASGPIFSFEIFTRFDNFKMEQIWWENLTMLFGLIDMFLKLNISIPTQTKFVNIFKWNQIVARVELKKNYFVKFW